MLRDLLKRKEAESVTQTDCRGKLHAIRPGDILFLKVVSLAIILNQVDLAVVASNTTDGRLLVLNHHTSPDCPVVWAVRMSMSIPLVWNEVIWDKGWGTYL